MSWIPNNMPPTGAGWWQAGSLGSPDGQAATGAFGWNGANAPSDAYRPTWWGGGNQTGPESFGPGNPYGTGTPAGDASGILGQIVSLLQQLVAGLGMGGAAASAPGSTSPLQQPGATFQNATLSSTGDPHLALTGTMQNADGTTTAVNDHYDSMTAHHDLLSTNDFGDRFRVSTTVTQPNANGVTMNQTATAQMNHGRDRVTMGPGGAISIVDDGQATSIAAGQTLTLSGGETVTEAANGSVSIAESNANGEALTTTFANNGSGVDVTATASGGVTLAGDLVQHATANGVRVC